MTPEERKSLEARRAKLVKAKDDAIGQANQFAGGIAVIDDLLKTDRVELATFAVPPNGGADNQPNA